MVVITGARPAHVHDMRTESQTLWVAGQLADEPGARCREETQGRVQGHGLRLQEHYLKSAAEDLGWEGLSA